MEDIQSNKKHREKKTGNKIKKKDKLEKKKGLAKNDRKGNDPRAFTVNSMVRAKKDVQYGADKLERKLRNPMRNIEEEADIPPPLIVAVTGPPKVGKSLLIKCLVKNYTKVNLTFVGGPVTIVAGKNKRITFIECPNDLNAMVDISKIADLVLTLVDAKFGFEMETFEMLNMLQTHGFPKVMGVLTHLDLFKDSKTQRRTKKELKKRFWTELYDGAKLFYLSGLINGKYPKREIFNLSRFISVTKFKPLVWRTAHPYILVDRLEDLTEENIVQCNPYADRSVAFFGYVRGAALKKDTLLHVPGCGDLMISDLTILPDPCPLPSTLNQKKSLSDKEKSIYAPMSNFGQLIYDKDAVYINIPKNKILYSQPQSIVPDHKDDYEDDNDNDGVDEIDRRERLVRPVVSEGQKMVKGLQRTERTLDQSLSGSTIQLFGTSKPLENSKFEDDDENNSENNNNNNNDSEIDSDGDDEGDGIRLEDEDLDDDYYKDEEGIFQGKNGNDKEEGDSKRTRRPVPVNYKINEEKEDEENDDENDSSEENDNQLDDDEDNEIDGDDEGNSLSIDENDLKKDFQSKNKNNSNKGGSSKEIEVEKIGDYVASDLKWKESIVKNAKAKFKKLNLMDLVYGDSNNQDQQKQKQQNEESEEDFFKVVEDEKDDLQTTNNQKDSSKISFFSNNILQDEDLVESLKAKFTESNAEAQEITTTPSNDQKSNAIKEVEGDEDYMAEKEKKKEQFDQQYDTGENGVPSDKKKKQQVEEDFFSVSKNRMKEMSESTRLEFKEESEQNKVLFRGFGAGYYVRIICERVPGRFVQFHENKFPVLMGGVLQNEKDLTILEIRVKKHRWYNTILKTNNPIIYSIGWRRFESLPLYFMNSNRANEKSRMIKYTPKHLHCLSSFYGPSAPPGSGVLCIQSVDQREQFYHQTFRIAATGVVLQQKKTSDIYKKLKLIGYPHEIKKKTAFIKDMFNSELEVAKFIGAKIKTVSGIRGQIKKACKNPPGSFRATFEDQIKQSDIIFLRSWYPVTPKRYYNPITSLLLRNKGNWKGMKTVGHLRVERGIKLVNKRDSQYTPIKRRPVDEIQFAPLKISNNLASSLPFHAQPKSSKPIATFTESSVMLGENSSKNSNNENSNEKKRDRKRKISSLYDHPLLDRTIIREPKEKKVHQLLDQLKAIKKEKFTKKKQKTMQENKVRFAKKKKEEADREKIMKIRKKEFYKKNGKNTRKKHNKKK